MRSTADAPVDQKSRSPKRARRVGRQGANSHELGWVVEMTLSGVRAGDDLEARHFAEWPRLPGSGRIGRRGRVADPGDVDGHDRKPELREALHERQQALRIAATPVHDENAGVLSCGLGGRFDGVDGVHAVPRLEGEGLGDDS